MVLIAYPLILHPCRYTLDVMVCGRLESSHRVARHVTWTLLLSGVGLAIALYVPGINVVFQLLGGTSSAFVCFMLPAAFGWKLSLPQASGAGAVACTLAGSRTAWWVAPAPSSTLCNARVPHDRHRVSLHAGHCVLDQLSRPDRQHEMSLTRSVM